MTLQEILFIVSIVFFVLAGICIVLAAVVFFVRNIPDVQADLSGKKRAEAVAQISSQRLGRDRRKGVARVEPTSGSLDSGQLRQQSPLDNHLNQVPHVESVVSEPAVSAQQPEPEPMKPQRSYQVHSDADEKLDDAATTILPDDGSSTTILSAEDAQAATPSEDDALAIASSEAAVPEAAPLADDAVPEAAPSDDDATTILSTEAAPSDDDLTTILPTEAAPATSEGFAIVRKIVLRESVEFITAS